MNIDAKMFSKILANKIQLCIERATCHGQVGPILSVRSWFIIQNPASLWPSGRESTLPCGGHGIDPSLRTSDPTCPGAAEPVPRTC